MKLLAKIKNINIFRNSLEVIGFDEFKKLYKLSEDDYIEIITWKERDVRKHRKYFALMNCCLYHLPQDSDYTSLDVLRKTIQICIGNCDIAFDMEGNKQLQANSISFKNMDQVAFDNLYNKSLNYIVKVVLKDIDYQNFIDDILNFY